MLRKVLYLGCACAVLGLAAGEAWADKPGQVEEVIVTANKRQQRIQNVGLSIQSLSAATLQKRQVRSLADLAATVPGLSFSSSTANTPIYTLRGVGFNEASLGVYPAVSVYVDEVPLPFPVLGSHSAYDLSRLEVLKGPQGTLFGENATGGAINYIAAKPTDHLTAGMDAGYGSYNAATLDGYVSGPLANNLDGRFSFDSERMDGWQHDSVRDDHNGKIDYIAARAQLRWTPSDELTVSFNANGWVDHSQPQALQAIAIVPGRPTFSPPGEQNYPLTANSPTVADWSTGYNRPRSDREFAQAALRVDWEFTPGIMFTSLTSADYFRQAQTTDGDGIDLVTFDLGENDGNIHSFNQEFRISNTGSKTLHWLLGANYENSRTFENQRLQYGDSSNFYGTAPFHIDNSGVTNLQNIESYAFFGNIEYDVLEHLTLKGGVRYTDTDIKDDNCGYSPDGSVASLFTYLGSLFGYKGKLGDFSCYTLNNQGVPGSPYLADLSQNNVAWHFGMNYTEIPNTLLYWNISRGYKAGSFPTLAAATFAQLAPVTQEALTDYEVGFKSHTTDQRVDVDGSLFYYDYKDKQVRGKELDPIFGPLDELVNIPKSRVYGAELEGTLRPITGLTLTGGITYLDTEIENYKGPSVLGITTDFAGVPLPLTSRWSGVVDGEYDYRNSDTAYTFLGLTANARTKEDGVIGADRTPIPVTQYNHVAVGDPFILDGWTTFDARLGYSWANGRYRVMAYGKNIFNRYYWNGIIASNDVIARVPNIGATWGLTLSAKF